MADNAKHDYVVFMKYILSRSDVCKEMFSADFPCIFELLKFQSHEYRDIL